MLVRRAPCRLVCPGHIGDRDPWGATRVSPGISRTWWRGSREMVREPLPIAWVTRGSIIDARREEEA